MILRAALLLFVFSAPAFAACEHYAGHFDLEGKIGNSRNLGEASAFLPIACTQDRLLFTDLKFRADNLSNREANIGIGGRVQREDGIAGGYIYFDRKKSGETDKFYNQITTGAEWLADHWETRANIYIPLNGSKTIGSGVVVSDPYLAGTGIFIDRGGFQIKETPMYGADTEIGFQTTKDLWLYGGGFTFHGNDVPTITGARVRAKYDLTDKVSLNAEGQYDDERGRQGWLGARLSVPFGNANAARSRMTQSPVRDVDIVTQTKQQHSFQSTTALANPESGDAQRVIYVNNRAAANGDGSLENPYNTLADAQGELRDYDIVYVFHGDGTTTGQDQGFVIDKNNVSFIGEGSPLTFAGYTLRAAGQRPIITNTVVAPGALTGNGLAITGDNPSLAGFNVQDTSSRGIYILSSGDVSLQDISVYRSKGIYDIQIDAESVVMNQVTLRNVTSHDAQQHGIRVFTGGGGTIKQTLLEDVTVERSLGYGIYVSAFMGGGSGRMDEVILNRVHVVDTTGTNPGLSIRTNQSGSVIDNMRITNSTFNNGATVGIHVRTQPNSALNNLTLDNVKIEGNGSNGLLITVDQNAALTMNVLNSDIINNANNGINLTDNSDKDLILNFDGSNRIFGNAHSTAATYYDLRVRANVVPRTLDFRNNWWGQDSGVDPSQIDIGTAPAGTVVLTTPYLDSDPRP